MQLSTTTTFGDIAAMIGNSVDKQFEFDGPDGSRVFAIRKPTGGRVVRTAYLHVTKILQSGARISYREQKTGSFKRV